MGRSEERTDMFGDKYIQHFDDSGRKSGTTHIETDMFGDKYEQHRDQGGNKTGYSENRTDMFGDNYQQHRDQGDEKIGYSADRTDIFGDNFTQHFQQDGAKGGVHGAGLIVGEALGGTKKSHKGQSARDNSSTGRGGGPAFENRGSHSAVSSANANRKDDDSALKSAGFALVIIGATQFFGWWMIYIGVMMMRMVQGANGILEFFLLFLVAIFGFFIFLIGFVITLPTLIIQTFFEVHILPLPFS